MKGYALLDNDGMLDKSVTPHGGCWTSTPAPVTITVADTYYLVGGTSTAQALTLFTHATPGRLTYDGTITKDFVIIAKTSLVSSANNIVMKTRLAKNGTTDASSEQSYFKTTASDVKGFVTMTVISLAQGDYVELYVTCDNAGSTLTANEEVMIIFEP
jgi:hypothetical protein